MLFFTFSREMISEGLKLRENAPKDQFCCGKTLLKVKKIYIYIYRKQKYSNDNKSIVVIINNTNF